MMFSDRTCCLSQALPRTQLSITLHNRCKLRLNRPLCSAQRRMNQPDQVLSAQVRAMARGHRHLLSLAMAMVMSHGVRSFISCLTRLFQRPKHEPLANKSQRTSARTEPTRTSLPLRRLLKRRKRRSMLTTIKKAKGSMSLCHRKTLLRQQHSRTV